MSSKVSRSFSRFRESDESEDDYEYSFSLTSGRSGGLSWGDLLKKRLAVILGEAGIGKSFEFQHKADTLVAEGQAAFFLSLNMLDTPDGFNQALIDQNHRYKSWLNSNEPGYFFLDAVDEARLNSPAALRLALIAVRKALNPHLNRVSFYVSSRITDWSVPGVQDEIRQHLLNPIINAEFGDTLMVSPNAEAPKVEETVKAPAIDLEVFKLDPLSTEDAKKLADEFGATPIDAFWHHVEEGAYEFLATRPLDLQWMAARWKQTQTLGTYSELLEAGITHRLTEKNPSYVTSGAVLSRAQLREGSEQLAAACVFSGRAYVQVGEGEPADGTVAAADALPHWTALEHLRLLGAAIFDEATYGRVRFHSRAVREYLAACWVEKQIAAGLPASRALSLFIQAPFGQPVLLNSRRPVLCWLATLNTNVRQKVIRQFPEMLMFEGDPQRWSTDDVVEGFEGFVKKLESGFRPNWWNEASEVRRVARMLPPDLLAANLGHYAKKPDVFTRLLNLVTHGRVETCADIVFSVYRDGTSSERERRYALFSLSAVATPAHKTAIVDDLLSGILKSNELIAAGLRVVGIENLEVEQLTKVFSNTEPEHEFGGGPMAMMIKSDLLPSLRVEATLKLLSGLLAALPPLDIEKINRPAPGNNLWEGWILWILPDVLLRAFQLIDGSGMGAPTLLTDASLVVEKLRHTRYTNDEDFGQLRSEIEKHAKFRKHLALCIALSGDMDLARLHLTRMPGLIHLSKPDLDWLIQEANREDLDERTRQVWYTVARDIAFLTLRSTQRRQVLAALTKGVHSAARCSDITALRSQLIEGLTTRRRWELEQRGRKKEHRRQIEDSKSELIKELERIRSGEFFKAILWLVMHAAERGRRASYTKVDLAPVYRDFGSEVGDAFSEGLTKVWRQIDIPNPVDYLDNRMPNAGLVGLAGMNHAFAEGLEIAKLTPDEVTRAVQLCIWDHGKKEPWLDKLVEAYPDQVVAALLPWLEFELGVAEEAPILNTIDLTLNGPVALKWVLLKRAQVFLRERKISRRRLERRVCRELIDVGLASKDFVQELASAHLSAFMEDDSKAFPSEWFTDWATSDFPEAWRWIEENSESLVAKSVPLVVLVSAALEDTSWAKGLSGAVEETRALVALFHFLNASVEVTGSSANGFTQPSSVLMLRDRIPGILVSLQGASAQESLRALAAENAGTPMGGWLLNQADEHASAEAERTGILQPAEMAHFGEVYTRDPRTASELFDQVLGRLEEIREGVEGGPFSDRVLFAPKMEEKHLQIWLAARLDDTPRRRFIPRFVVTREPQVDNEKRTDIEASSAAGKVCVEIKPVGRSHKYTANSLTGTLRNQLVGQYMKGRNSRHGMLVLFRLDPKRWQIPGGPKHGEFGDLVNYLNAQASRIIADNDNVERLSVFGIDCVGIKE